MTFKHLIVIIISFQKSIQRELDSFYKTLTEGEFNIREVTKGAFSQARSKLNEWGFQRLNVVARNSFYENAPYHVWNNKRVLSTDGTRLQLPKHKTIIEEFGEHGFGPKADSKRSLATASILYDPLNQIVLDGQLGAYKSDERELLLGHLAHMKRGDLLLLDRGYPCIWLFFLLQAKGIDYCVRIKEDWWLEVKKFTDSKASESICYYELPKKDYDKLSRYPKIRTQKIACRLIRIELPNGEIEILCTSLTNKKKYVYESFAELYHYRWNEEEAFKLLKSRIELERFSGKTARAVKQDFHAKLFLMTLCSAYAHPIEEKVREEYKQDEQRKFEQKINRTNALAVTKSILINILIKKTYAIALKAFDALVYKTREIIRPGRSNPRNIKPKRPYSMAYKPL